MVTARRSAGQALRRTRRAAPRAPLAGGRRHRSPPGEYAVHEGDERALFAVLEGRIEVVKLVDGIAGLGERRPATSSARCRSRSAPRSRSASARRSRRASCASSRRTTTPSPPSRRRSRSRSASSRAKRMGGGLQGIAAEPAPPRAIVVGHRWDAECAELRRFLDRNQITFEWLSPDAPDAAEHWGRPAAGRRRLPGSASSTARPWCAPAAPGRRAPRAGHRGRRRRVRHGDHRRRAGRAGGRRVRRVRGPAHAGRSSARHPAARPARPRGSRTTSAFRPASPATSWPAARCSRRGGSARRSS